MNEQIGVMIPMPQDSLYQGREGGYREVLAEPRPYPFVERYEYPEEGGIYVYQFGAEVEEVNGEIKFFNKVPLLYPLKGFPSPKTVWACDIAKRFLLTQLKFFTDKSLWWLWLGVVFYPKKWKLRLVEQWLEFYTQSLERVLPQYYLKEKLQMKISKEVGKLVYNFLKNWGITNERVIKATADTFNAFIENDTAYRYRLEDLMLCTSKELMVENPYREILKLCKILGERDTNVKVNQNLNKLRLLLKGIFIISPSAKKSFIKAIEQSNFQYFQMDEADRYHTLNQCGYKFGGREDDDRVEEYKRLHGCTCPTKDLKSNEVVCDCGKVPKLYYLETFNQQIKPKGNINTVLLEDLNKTMNNLNEDQKKLIDQATTEIQAVLDKYGLAMNITPLGYNIALLPKPEQKVIEPVQNPIITPS